MRIIPLLVISELLALGAAFPTSSSSAASPLLAVSNQSSGSSMSIYDGATGSLIHDATVGARPRGITFGPDGNVYAVLDRSDDQIVKIDPVSGSLVGVFAGRPGMGLPNDLVFGPDGNLYVAKWDLGEVLRFNGSTGQFIDVFAAHPINSNSNFEPAGLAFGPNGNLYVGTGNTGSCPDSFCNAVLRYDGTTGSFIDIFVASGTGQLNDPWEIEFGPDGNLYARTSGDAILRFDGTTGDFIDRFAEGDPEFGDDFVGFDFGYDGNLYVANHSGEKGILRFDGITGEFIDVFIAGGLQLTLPLWIEFSSPPSPAVPTLTPRAIATLVALLGTVALWAVRRQRAVGI